MYVPLDGRTPGPAVNSTDDALATDNREPATGQSIMWALVAIIFQAMQQPSFSGYLSTGDAFKGTLWPQRSSHVICFVDMVADLCIIRDRCQDASNIVYAPLRPAKPTVIITRLAVFLVAVLPQAIKLFSMRGIPFTQLLAAMFFISSLVSMMRTILVEDPSKDTETFVCRLKEWKHWGLVAGVVTLARIGHGVCIVLTWYSIYKAAVVDVGENLANLIEWFSVIGSFVFLIYAMQHILFRLAGSRPRLPGYPLAILYAVVVNSGIADLQKDSKDRTLTELRACMVAIDVLLFSYGITHFLGFLTKSLLSWSGPAADSIVGNASGTVGTVNHPVHIMSGALDGSQQSATAGIYPQEQAAGDSATLEHDNPPSQRNCRSDHQVGTPLVAVQRPVACLSRQHVVASSGQELGEARASSWRALSNGSPSTLGNDEIQDKPSYQEPATLPRSLHATSLTRSRSFPHLARLATREMDTGEQGSVHPPDQSTNAAYPETVHPRRFEFMKDALWLLARGMAILCLNLAVILWEVKLLFDWIEHRFRRQPSDKTAIAWGLATFITAVVYYLACFDGSGTSVPSWTSILG